MNTTSWVGTIAVVAVLLAGCSDSAQQQQPVSDDAPTASHTMPDGTVMSGSEMPGTDQSVGDEPESKAEPVGASPAARMVCSGDVVDDVTRILALEELPEPTSSWAEPMFTCSYQLDEGPLVLSVHDATDRRSGREYFDRLRTQLGDTEKLRGMYGLGLPAYETDDGTVVFIKDGKTLKVDATALPGGLGPDGSMSQTDLAYAVATSVLACWTAHT